MRQIRFCLVTATLAIALAALGCGPADAPDTSNEYGAATKEELAERVSAAVTAKDIEAMMRLYYPGDLDDAARERQRTMAEGFFQGSVVSHEWMDSEAGYTNEFVRDGMLHRLNAEMEGHLRIRYGDDRTGPRTAVAFPYGKRDGRYYLPVVVRIPVDTTDERNTQLSLITHGEGPGGKVGFEATCSYMSGDEGKEETFSGTRGTTRVFWGRMITRCSVKKTSEGGWLEFRIRTRDAIIFDSPRIEDDAPFVWALEGESQE
jgi:hypothetical protein